MKDHHKIKNLQAFLQEELCNWTIIHSRTV